MAAAHESVLNRGNAPAQKSAALPLAIAAILVLGLAGGAWAFRDRIPMLQQFMPASQTVAIAPTPASAPEAPAVPPGPAAPVAPPVAANDANGTLAGNAGAAANTAATPPPPAGASLADIIGTSGAANSKPATAAPAASNAASGADEATATGPAPRASQVEPLRDLAAAQAADAPAKPQRVASIKPPPPVSAPPRPHIPTIAVIAAGDELVSEPAERSIEQALSKHGYHLVDQNMMPRVDHLLRGPRPNVPEILNTLRRRGDIDAIVVVHARAAGAQQITFYGQSDTLKTAQLSVTAFSIDGRKLGAGWNENVNFTAMSASDKAEEAVEPMLAQIEDRLSEYRPHGRRE
jgi:serine/threonine-protein kinase